MLVKRIRSRGANIVVEANGEVLFAPGLELSRWKNQFSRRVRATTIAEAPTNKRPRWGHYGKPLKATITASTSTRITKGGGFFYIAVGSSSPHAYYVDQGTGIYAGRGPYEAKVLPPWHRGSPTLYESTWRPAGPRGRRVAKVLIKGQKGQGFFDEGLKRGFEAMRIRSVEVPGEGVSGLTGAMKSFPEGLANFIGNTPNDGAFRASLAQWRGWRDAAWRGEHGAFGNAGVGGLRNSRLVRRRAEIAAKKATLAKKKKMDKPKSPAVNKVQRKADKANFIKAMKKKYGRVEEGTVFYRDGRWYMTVWGKDARGRDTWIEVTAKAKS